MSKVQNRHTMKIACQKLVLDECILHTSVVTTKTLLEVLKVPILSIKTNDNFSVHISLLQTFGGNHVTTKSPCFGDPPVCVMCEVVC